MIIESLGISSIFTPRTAVGLRHLWFLAGMILLTACQEQDGYVVLRQVTARPAETNAYLLYDISTGEAALFDIGGPVDSLVAAIDQEGLRVKYLFSTHGHPDHVQGLPEIRDLYPQAQWGVSREELEGMSLYAAWEEVLPPEEVATIKAAAEQDPAVAEMFDFDYSRLHEPDLFLEDGEVYRLGDFEIHTYVTPGHSRGSICFHVGNALFSGDVLFQGRVGGTDNPRSGGIEAMTESVHRLYQILPDETIVYPGHGEFTDIGTEKLQGTEIHSDPGGSP
jgi:glyoxylase-like metal-dependent hydrolase (beta-lactamase superfamily II)